MNRLLPLLTRAALPLLLILIWEAISRAGLVPATLLPAPSVVLVALWRAALTSVLWLNLAVTLQRLAAGFLIALVVGVVLGLAGAESHFGARVLEAMVRVFAPIPKIALYPAMILLLGFDNAPKIMLVAADCVFPILLATFQGARQIEAKLLWSARAMGTGPFALMFKVVLPACLPQIMTGARIAATVGCVVVFLAEMIASTDGLGHLLALAVRTFRIVDMFVPLVIISAIGLLLNALLARLQRSAVR